MEERDKKIKRRTFFKTAVSAAAVTALGGGVEKEVLGAATIPGRKLGSSGLSVPILMQGTAQSLDPSYDRVLHLCYREGAKAYDTALSYGWGSSHRALATFLGQVKDRENIWITSKSSGSSPGRFTKGLDECLRELKSDYLDLYLMHSISSPGSLTMNMIRAGEKLKRSGKTKLFGFSTHSNCAEVMKAAAKKKGIDAILFRYSYSRSGDRDLNLAMDACKKAGIGLIAMKTMNSVSGDAERVVKYKSKNFTLPQAKLKAVWEDERIDTIVCEMTSLGEARENISAARSGKGLAGSDYHQLNRLSAHIAHLSCQGCSEICESRLSGDTRVADILRYLMYHEGYGKNEEARRLYHELPPECREFNKKELLEARKECPQGIDIAARLEKAKKIFG
jgi:predicted aldo/keto reductase-like oxidoreductase